MPMLRFRVALGLQNQLNRAEALTRALRIARRKNAGFVPTLGVAVRIVRTQGAKGLKLWLPDLANTEEPETNSKRSPLGTALSLRFRIQKAMEAGRIVLRKYSALANGRVARLAPSAHPQPLFDSVDIASAERAEVLVAITFHFVERRLVYLEDVLRSLAAFGVRRKLIVVYTNTTVPGERLAIEQSLARANLKQGQDAEIVVDNDLPHPFELTWCHKRLITERFCAANSTFTHFVYLEDDERLTFENFAYFIAAREHLKPHGLIPAFVRTEWSEALNGYVNVDSPHPTTLRGRPFVRIADHAFINLEYPYCGAFILDRELAREYIASPAFDLNLSKTISPFEVRERAAMGLTFTAPPQPFLYRVAIPVAVRRSRVPQCAWLAHIPNNYAQDPASPFGKLAMGLLIQDEPDPDAEQGKANSEQPPPLNAAKAAHPLIRLFQVQRYFPSSLAMLSAGLLEKELRDQGARGVLLPKGAKLSNAPPPNNGGTARQTGADIPLEVLQLGSVVARRTPQNRAILILTSSELDQLLIAADRTMPWCALAVVASTADVQKLRTSMFDIGMIEIGHARFKGKVVHCFLASEMVTRIDALPISARGFVTMSSLGSNGRFANQLFQYAFVKLYALRNDLTAAVPHWEGASLFDLKDPLPPQIAFGEVRCATFGYDEQHLWDLQPPPSNIDIRGYCQELPVCWRQQRPLLKRLYSLSDERTARLDDWCYDITRGGLRTLVAVHVRRGDYRGINHDEMPWFRMTPVEWYLDLLRSIWPTLHNPVLFVATDEPEAIVPRFRDFPLISASGEQLATIPDHVVDFEILRRADLLAICNSSFSRMAALLAYKQQTCFIPDFSEHRFIPFEPWYDLHFWRRFAKDPISTSQ